MNTMTHDSGSCLQPDPVGVSSEMDPHSVKASTNDGASSPLTSRDNRCQYRFSNGKRCRLTGSKSHFGLCSHHFSLSSPVGSQQQWPSDSEDLSPELLGEPSEFESAIDINKFLAKLLVLVTKGRISPRRASVLAYITNQLLHSHRAIILETKAEDDRPQEIIFDMPRPKRD